MPCLEGWQSIEPRRDARHETYIKSVGGGRPKAAGGDTPLCDPPPSQLHQPTVQNRAAHALLLPPSKREGAARLPHPLAVGLLPAAPPPLGLLLLGSVLLRPRAASQESTLLPLNSLT